MDGHSGDLRQGSLVDAQGLTTRTQALTEFNGIHFNEIYMESKGIKLALPQKIHFNEYMRSAVLVMSAWSSFLMIFPD
jgi:hypothetical protein